MKILTTQELKEAKEASLSTNLQRKTVLLSDIQLGSSTTIIVGKDEFPMTREAFEGLVEFLGLGTTAASNIDFLFSAEASVTLLNKMRIAMSKTSSVRLTLFYSKEQRKIVNIVPSERVGSTTAQQFVNFCDTIVSKLKLDIVNWSFGDGLINVDAIARTPHEIAGEGFREVFNPGISLSNCSIHGMTFHTYINRLACGNGMMVRTFTEKQQLKTLTDAGKLSKFVERLQFQQKKNFVPPTFTDRVEKAIETPASIREMRYAVKAMKEFMRGDDKESTEQFIPLQANLDIYSKSGQSDINYSKSIQAPTNQSMWSVINGLTYFATHSKKLGYNVGVRDTAYLLAAAGALLERKEFDQENVIRNPFSKNVLKDTEQIGAILN